MRGLLKSKRVSWAPDFSLCQVRLFLSEESPSQVGLGTQDHLQAKASHHTGTAGDDTLPPGFEGGHSVTPGQINLSEVPIIKWRCPPRIFLNISWQVVAGNESQEVEIQNEREMRVLEAVYPRPSAIPQKFVTFLLALAISFQCYILALAISFQFYILALAIDVFVGSMYSPTFSMDLEESKLVDHQAPLIPITPIEDEDVADAPEFSGTPDFTMNLQPQNLVPGLPPPCNIPGMPSTPFTDNTASQVLLGVEADAVAAANAALTVINRCNEQGNLIDRELLLKILNNPNLMEKLFADSAVGSNPKACTPASLSDPPHPLVTISDPSHLHMNRMDPTAMSLTASMGGTPYVQPNGVGPGVAPNVRLTPPVIQASPAPSVGAPQIKDLNYYKSLIQQHGAEKQEMARPYGSLRDHQVGTNHEYANPKSRDLKTKFMKPCIYYNSSRGCRNGANCAYQHDSSSLQRGTSNISEAQSSKRMKMDREISS